MEEAQVVAQENKAISFKIEGGVLKIEIDPNKDGDQLLALQLNLAEVPDEVLSLFNKKA